MTQKLGLPCDICPSSWVWAAGRLGSHQELSNSVPKEIGSRGTKRSSHPSVKVSWASTRNPFMSNIITLFLWGCIPIELEYLEFEMIENHRNSAGDFSHHSQPSSAPYRRLTVQPFDQISSTPTDSPARCVELNIPLHCVAVWDMLLQNRRNPVLSKRKIFVSCSNRPSEFTAPSPVILGCAEIGCLAIGPARGEGFPVCWATHEISTLCHQSCCKDGRITS